VLYTELFNEITVVFCIYLVMLFMMSMDFDFLDTMTKKFIVITGVNVITFMILAIKDTVSEFI